MKAGKNSTERSTARARRVRVSEWAGELAGEDRKLGLGRTLQCCWDSGEGDRDFYPVDRVVPYHLIQRCRDPAHVEVRVPCRRRQKTRQDGVDEDNSKD